MSATLAALRAAAVDTLRIARADLSLFVRFPRLCLAAFGVSLFPAVYALIYLSSVWDPNARTHALPALIVNQDQGLVYQGQAVNVGAELAATLARQANFGFRTLNDAQAARRAVSAGDVAFALLIPPDFSANALPGATPGSGKVIVVVSEGNNYTSAGFARRFAAELGHQVNETLNEKRWALVLEAIDGSERSLANLKAGVAQLRSGAVGLGDGVRRYVAGATQVSDGMRRLGAGIRQIDARLPAESDLKPLRAGAQQLVTGQRELGSGIGQLRDGAGRLAAGARHLQTETTDLPFVGARIAAAAGELAGGGDQLEAGLGRAAEGNARLVQGAVQLRGGINTLTDGLGTLGEAIGTMHASLPDDTRLDALETGGRSLQAGASRLVAGLTLLDESIPATLSHPGGSARGLADSVEPVVEVQAPVANNGSAFAPNMVSIALWIGAVMAAYLFRLTELPASLAGASRTAKAAGKFLGPALITLIQSLLAFLMLVVVMRVQSPSLATFALTIAVASLAFLAIVIALQCMFGEAGKLLAVLLLTVQLAAGGGILPVELSGGFFQAIHTWLPFSWVVRAFRASLFGAFDNDWFAAWALVTLAAAVAIMLTALTARWRTVPDEAYRPAVEM